MKHQQVVLKQGEEEIDISTLVSKVFSKLKDAPESLTDEDQQLFAAGARMGMDFLSDFEELADPIKALLYICPQMASYFLAMFTGGMFLHRALVNPNNDLSIYIEEVEGPDNSSEPDSSEGSPDPDGAGCSADSGDNPSGSPSGESLGGAPGAHATEQ